MVDIQARDPGQVDSVTQKPPVWGLLDLLSLIQLVSVWELWQLHSLENIKISEMLVTQHQLRLALDHSPLKSFSGTIVLLVTKILCYFPDFKDIISVTS